MSDKGLSLKLQYHRQLLEKSRTEICFPIKHCM